MVDYLLLIQTHIALRIYINQMVQLFHENKLNSAVYLNTEIQEYERNH